MSLPAQSGRLKAADVDAIAIRHPGRVIHYGTGGEQTGELRIPEGPGPFAVAIVVHGGCWYSPYAGMRNTAALAEAVADRGVATWNVEYRRYDQAGGGWPGTFLDVAAAADFVRELAQTYPLDTTRVVAVGHSAGAQLALWLASRHRLAANSALVRPSPLPIAAVVSIGGITDLREFYLRERSTCGNPAVESLLGGAPTEVPDRVRDASPIERLPLGVPSVHIAGSADFIAPRAVVDAYATAARARGDTVEVQIIPGDGHFEAISPAHAAGRAVIDAIVRLSAPHGPATRMRR